MCLNILFWENCKFICSVRNNTVRAHNHFIQFPQITSYQIIVKDHNQNVDINTVKRERCSLSSSIFITIKILHVILLYSCPIPPPHPNPLLNTLQPLIGFIYLFVFKGINDLKFSYHFKNHKSGITQHIRFSGCFFPT